MSIDDKYAAAMDAISALHGDCSVPQSVTKDKLEEMIGEIQDMINGLEDVDT